jgi:CelD/BcsL family acetyltransferase involved in cellulose biosynthesis
MQTTVVPGRALSTKHLEAWSELQDADLALASPFLCPEFTVAVAAARDDINVAILEEGGEKVGFFPFQRGRFSIGYPVGGPLNDLQGVIVRPDLDWDAMDLIRRCGLIAWDFGRLLACQKPFESTHRRRHISALIDVSKGYKAYVEERRLAGTEQVKKTESLARKLDRENGPLRFELHTSEERHLATLMKWKFDRYSAEGYEDLFAIPWIRQVMKRIHATQRANFGGVLSVLYAGKELAAAHMGIRSRRIWHYWFPAYNPKYARYSPGLILLLKMVQHSSTLGPDIIELGGPSDYLYKQRLMNSEIDLAEGTIERPSLANLARRVGRASKEWIRRSRLLYPPVRSVVRALRRITHSSP